MSSNLEKLKDIINNRIFTIPVLEVRSFENEETKIVLKSEYNDSEFILEHQFDDLLNIHTNCKLFTIRAKKFIQELADEQGIKIKFLYSQCILEEK